MFYVDAVLRNDSTARKKNSHLLRTRNSTTETKKNISCYIQILRHPRGQGNIHFLCSADHEQDWQPYPVDRYTAICDDHTYINTENSTTDTDLEKFICYVLETVLMIP